MRVSLLLFLGMRENRHSLLALNNKAKAFTYFAYYTTLSAQTTCRRG
ncbi:hypothetical protein VCHE16_2496 [Vibrio paracholerae HE-16]|nr:hypothetical protein VCHE09_1525 [Vibrio paracholerae HE-09]EKG85955.1 hypothetical protein VCHE16_2496 [Vibrio paracholerae HE-16]EMP92994.1 hypothetical protein VC87395_001713 [Vibrio paracholerae 87395]